MLTLRKKIYRLMEKRRGWGLVVNAFIALLVVTSVVSMIVSSVEEIYQENPTVFFVIEAVTVALFMVEYLVRLWVCVGKA
jgi:voltage-gated potassium channel